MAGIWGDTLAADPLYALQDAVAAGQNWLIQTGLIAYIWIFVAAIVIISIGLIVAGVRNFKFGQIAIGSGGLFLAGIISLVAIGNAIFMVLPVGIAYGVYALARRAIKKREESGAAEEEEAQETKREAEEEAQEAAAEGVEEQEAEQEVVAERAIKNVEYNKSQVVQMLGARMNLFQNAGYNARDAQFGIPVQNVIIELLSRLINFERQEQGAAARMFGLEKAQDKINALEEARESKEKKLAGLSARLEGVTEGFLKKDLPREGRNTKQLVQNAYQLGQRFKALSQAQAQMQRRVAQLEPMKRKARALSEQNTKKFKALAGQIVSGLNGVQKSLQSAAQPAQVVNSYRRIVPLLGQSQALVQQHSAELKQLFAVREQELGAKGQELMDEGQLDELEGRRESILARLSGIKGDKKSVGERGLAMQEIRGALNTLKPTLQKVESLKARAAQGKVAA